MDGLKLSRLNVFWSWKNGMAVVELCCLHVTGHEVVEMIGVEVSCLEMKRLEVVEMIGNELGCLDVNGLGLPEADRRK